MTLEKAVATLKAWGCTVDQSDEDDKHTVTMVDPAGNDLHLKRGSYTIVAADPDKGTFMIRRTDNEDETTHVEGKAYGLSNNDPEFMATILDMAWEGDDDYQEIMEQLYPIMKEFV